MIKKKLLVGLLAVSCALSLVACGSDDDKKDKDSDKEKTTATEKVDVLTTEEVSDTTEAVTEAVESKIVHLAWIKENSPKFRKDASAFSGSTIAVLPGNPELGTVLDNYMTWCAVLLDGHPQLSEILDKEIKKESSLDTTFKETKELAESFDKGPKGEIQIRFENHSEDTITVQQAIDNKWYIINLGNYKDVYTSTESALYINLGYTSSLGYANGIDDVTVINDYLIKYYGEPNYCGVSMNYDFKTVDELIASDSAGTQYDLGWIGDEYGVFITVRKDLRNDSGDIVVDAETLKIIPKEMLEFTNSFSGAPYHTGDTVYTTNLIK